MRKRAGNLSGCNKKDIFAIASNAMAKMSFYIYVIGVYCAWVMCFANGKNGGLAAVIQKKY